MSIQVSVSRLRSIYSIEDENDITVAYMLTQKSM